MKWFFTKKFFWKTYQNSEIKIQSFEKQSKKRDISIHRLQKFLCKVDRHETTDFLFLRIFWLRSFFGPFSRYHGSKNDRSQKSYKSKKSLFSCPSTMQKNFLNLFILGLYICNCSPKLWIFICEFWQVFQKTFLVKNHS